ncbi:MAG TPA: ABC transporter permease [Candidatus Thermoplasmatota archaeon]|nr:ABC transporter permease [Candidatus Thermoplasmatota archaeon]
MKAHRVLAVSRKTFLTLRHDPRSVALIVLAPIMAMLIFGFAFGSEAKDVRTVVVNHDQGSFAAELISRLDREALSLSNATDEAAARQAVRDGERTAVLVFPANFTQDASPRVTGAGAAPPKGATIEVFLDTTNNQLAAVVLREIGEAGQALARDRGISVPVAPSVAYAYPEAKDARFIDHFVPGVMAFASTLFTTLLTLLAFVGERANGTLDRLRVTPATEGEIVLGYEVAFGLVAAVQGLLLITAALLFYGVLVVGPLWVAAVVIVLLAIDAQAIGILISAAARREGQAVQMIPFIVLPVFLLSGVFVPVQSLLACSSRSPGSSRPPGGSRRCAT